MISTSTIPAKVSGRFLERLRELSISVVRLTPEGGVAAEESLNQIERLVAASRMFSSAVHHRWTDLGERTSQVVELWPGVSLVPLPDGVRRRMTSMHCPLYVNAALILGPSLVNSEQLQAICREAELDYRATVARIDPARLSDPAEARRLALTLAWICEDAVELDRQSSELRTLSQELADSYEELSLLYKFSSNMVVDHEPAQFLSDACDELHQVVGMRWMAVCLIDDEPRLEGLAGRRFVAGRTGLSDERFATLSTQLLDRYADTPQPVIVDDTTTLALPDLVGAAGNLLVVPLRREQRTLGLILGGDKLDAAHISSIDSKLCDSLANSLTIFLENLMLYEDSRAMFMGTLHALTSAIDAKDTYTHGHSERVALLSRQLAAALGMPPEQVERVYIAGLVHDVGKIGVPEAVLTKPGRLTREEFEQIKKHPEIGAQIVRDIRQMKDLIPGVLHHHERWDGKGYPYGLAGADIPEMGRIIGLADAFDAMSSNRTYRALMDRARVLQEIKDCAGTQFDPEMADVFVGLDFGDFDRMIESHQQDQGQGSAKPSPQEAA